MRIHPGISPASYAVEEALRGSPAPVLFPLVDRPWPDLVTGIAATFSIPPRLAGSRMGYMAALEELRRGPAPPFGVVEGEPLFRFAEALARFFPRLDQAAPKSGEPVLNGLRNEEMAWFDDTFRRWRKRIADWGHATEGEVLRRFIQGEGDWPAEFGDELEFVGFFELSPLRWEALKRLAELGCVRLRLRYPEDAEEPALERQVKLIEGQSGGRVLEPDYDFGPLPRWGGEYAAVHGLRMRDRFAEVRWIAQRMDELVADGVPPNRIGIAPVDAERYRLPLKELAKITRVPLAWEHAEDLRHAPLWRWLPSLLASLDEPTPENLFVWTPPFDLDPPHETAKARRLFALAGIGAFSGEWEEEFRAQAKSERLGDEPTVSRCLALARRRLGVLHRFVRHRSLTEWLGWLKTLVAQSPWPGSLAAGDAALFALEWNARKTSAALLDEWETVADAGRDWQGGDFLREVFALLHARLSRRAVPDPDAAEIFDPSEIGSRPFMHLFVPGITQDAFPPPPFTAILPERALAELNRAHPLPLFPTARDHAARWLYRLRLGRASCLHLYLSHPAVDESGEPCRPAPVLEDVFGQALTFEEVDAPEGEIPVSPETLRHLKGKRRDLEKSRRFHYDTDPATRCDRAHEFTGSFVERLPETMEKRLAAFDSLSAGALETYATCPFRFLLERVYRLKVPAEILPDPSPLVTGTAVHEALEAFFRPRLGKALKPHGPGERAELFACFETAFGNLARHWPEERRKLARLKARRWSETTDRLLADPPEILKDSIPLRLETSFGMDENRDGPEIPLRHGGTLRLKGRIDRIDCQGTNLLVIDYKTSSDLAGYKRRLKPENRLKNAFQAPIYLLSALQTIREREASGALAFESVAFAFLPLGVGDAAVLALDANAENDDPFWMCSLEKRQSLDETHTPANFADRLDTLHRAMKAGDFQVTPLDCTYCEFKAVCRVRLMPRSDAS